MPKPRLLLHACCATCSGYLARELSKDHDLTVYFDNSNIFPKDEFFKRADEARKYFTAIGFEFVQADYLHEEWLALVQGLEGETERGERCLMCYRFRLENAAVYARHNGFDSFASTLAISPHKHAEAINAIGQALANEYCVGFLAGDWKKHDGFKNAMCLSKEQGFYRQDYCGCEFSRRC